MRSRRAEQIEEVHAGKVLFVVRNHNAVVRPSPIAATAMPRALLGRPACVPWDMRRAQMSALLVESQYASAEERLGTLGTFEPFFKFPAFFP